MSIQALSNYLFGKDFISSWKIDGHSKNLIPEIDQDKQNKFWGLLKNWLLLAKRPSVSSGYIVRKDFFKYFNRK
ncbi:hypothetical protein [Liquorilactobacillus mali]|uniref:Uncharacterized protein n=1 Tax=Liquorilactobacillus mali TaxID=1618 RepID=A0A0R2FJU3_9LACO|nr:hypothetical protein [Liquorilactobacillus mali]KRN26581.1 hypothetical protein IV36_GL001819 [Liquorilactobacillus mali]